jgi:hypothetical protein
MKDRRVPSLKEVASAQPQQEETHSKAPKYITKKTEFYCSLSPDIMWHHGMYYKDCPLCAAQRDMPCCGNCKLRWQGIEKKKKEEKVRLRKETPVVENGQQEPIPVIGKTYNAE